MIVSGIASIQLDWRRRFRGEVVNMVVLRGFVGWCPGIIGKTAAGPDAALELAVGVFPRVGVLHSSEGPA